MLKLFTCRRFRVEKEYLFNVIFNYILGLTYSIEFHDSDDTWIILQNGNKIIIEDHFFRAHNEGTEYLSESSIPETIQYAKNDFTDFDIVVLYGNPSLTCIRCEDFVTITIGIDLLAGIFFMLTRWEEFVINEIDIHQRFNENKSLSIKHQFYHRAIVDEYCYLLHNIISSLDSTEIFRNKQYKAIITHDIDFIARYDNLGKLFSAVGGDLIIRKNLFLPLKSTYNYLTAKLSIKKDVYDTFDFLMDVSEENGLTSLFYFIGLNNNDPTSTYDIFDINLRKTLTQIIKRGHKIGIHGSYNSINSLEIFKEELSRFNSLCIDVKDNRQHYLRMKVPFTWRIWDAAGISIDSSMGFHDHLGFRCGTSHEFPLFDFLNRKTLNVIEQPLIFMDVAASRCLKSNKDIFGKIQYFKSIIERFNGNFVLLYHNDCFNNLGVKASEFKDIISAVVSKQ